MASNSHDDVVCVSSKHLPIAHASKLSNFYRFNENLDGYSVLNWPVFAL